tara:strand:+ start:1232 stop:1540 length:309 start_codon:yes stop_codon:yes gene_type:complete
MNTHITNIVRSSVLLACVLPITIAVTSRVNVGSELARKRLEVSPADAALTELKDKLTEACIKYRYAKPDSSLERKSQTVIDEHFDGDVFAGPACLYVLNGSR